MALDAFVKIDGIPGETTDDGHKEWIQVRQIEHIMSQKASPSTVDAGGITAAKPEHQPLRIRKFIDKASPVLAEQCASGKHIPTVTIEFMRSSGNTRVKFMKIDLAEAIVSKIEQDGKEAGDDVPSEWVSFSYGKIKWSYITHSRSGDPGGTVPGGWDLTKNIKWS